MNEYQRRILLKKLGDYILKAETKGRTAGYTRPTPKKTPKSDKERLEKQRKMIVKARAKRGTDGRITPTSKRTTKKENQKKTSTDIAIENVLYGDKLFSQNDLRLYRGRVRNSRPK